MQKEHDALMALLRELLKVEKDQAVKLAAAIEDLVDAKLAHAFDAHERLEGRN
jgi:Mn-dependent DtxR family transcriptional regulator